MTPEQQLKLFLVENGWPDRYIPLVLRHCPQLLDSYSIEEIGTLAVTKHQLFVPTKYTLTLSPIVHQAAVMECNSRNPSEFVEEAMAILASDSLENCFKDHFTELYKALSKASKR